MIDRRTVLTGTLAAIAAPSLAAKGDLVVETSVGRVRGLSEGSVRTFRGIRYGAAKRFQAPVAPPRAKHIIDAVAFGPSALQRGGNYQPQSEDCLFLNIWTPEAKAGADLPVMVYFHGGAYSTGSVVDPLNDGRHLAAKGVVVVTANHRLNAFGYLYLARIDPRFPDSGNLGQLDLILALQWIQANIAAFGGDRERITVFGQSGGGAKIATLMGMPAAAGLFHRAATMSGQQVTASGPMHATERARAYLAHVKATPDELLTLPVEQLVDGLAASDPVMGGGIYFGPVLDAKWLNRHPFWPDANPQSNAIPMILGNTRDEARAFFGPNHPKIVGMSWDNLAERLGPELKVDISPEWVVEQYRRLFPTYSPEQLFFAATTAGRSWRGQIEEAEARSRAAAPTWVYQLDFASPVDPWRGAPHTMDIPLVFGTLDAPGSITGTSAASRAVCNAMMDAFVAFAGSGKASWSQYRLPERATMIFDAPPRVENDPRKEQREIFARVPYIQPGT